MTSPTAKILLATNSEYGQANIFLAVACELALRNVDLHLASFSPLQKRLTQHGLVDKLSFHLVPGLSFEDALLRTADANMLSHPPGVQGALQSYKWMADLLLPWTAEEYHHQLLSIKNIVQECSPSIVVIDSLFLGALDACRELGQRYVVLSPNSPRDFVGMTQPALRGFWKYPALSSGYPYPVPLALIPANIYLNIRMIIKIVTSPLVKTYDIMRKEHHGLTKTAIDNFSPDIPYLLPALPQTDFPDLLVPSNVHMCGPILFPSSPLDTCDPETSKWVNNPGMKTVLVNLGSHIVSNVTRVRELAGGLRILLSKFNEVQVLWKVMADGEIRDTLKEVVDPDRMKVVHWLEAEPAAVLRHPNVICSVHHGGANSFFEAVSAGVPHVILPVWYDTYDYARRAEYLGIGLFGSVNSAPGADAEEFGRALIRVIGDGSFAAKAQALAQSCGNGVGRKLAADKILGFIS
ncbi:hypothetical protein D9758_000857 [Tetrapyrgos nigripes]|uniref:UDP-glucoronosyl and UDP-glucosyl transferase family protein n=1 Tax=Tetrapyrgos nigripes TaxID=182062 RepID=A0A8H5GZD9_9AGAR|nr:hypothetical protein D9758_000857 [Tetrapyrgos nigripes]